MILCQIFFFPAKKVKYLFIEMNLMLGSGMVCVDLSLFFFYYESHTAASFSSARSDYIIYNIPT